MTTIASLGGLSLITRPQHPGLSDQIRTIHGLVRKTPPATRFIEMSTPVPHTVAGPARFRLPGGMKPETRQLRRTTAVSFPDSRLLVGASAIYGLGFLALILAFIDLNLYVDRGSSSLGPQMDIVFMMFGIGLMLVSTASLITSRSRR